MKKIYIIAALLNFILFGFHTQDVFAMQAVYYTGNLGGDVTCSGGACSNATSTVSYDTGDNNTSGGYVLQSIPNSATQNQTTTNGGSYINTYTCPSNNILNNQIVALQNEITSQKRTIEMQGKIIDILYQIVALLSKK